MSRISQALMKLFERHRIVFWYDDKQELRKEYDALALEGIEKIELENNEFAIKYRLLRQQPKTKFLIYSESAQPEDGDNWLLDILLAQGEFRTDQAALWLNELELGLPFAHLIEEHLEFFKAEKTRLPALKKRLSADDTESVIRLKMLAVCCGADPRLDNILEKLLEQLANNKQNKFKLIQRCQLENFLWDLLDKYFAYQSDTLSLEDFSVALFKSCYAMATEGEVSLNNDALVFLKRWKDSRLHEASFEALSQQYGSVLNIENDLHQRDFRHLIEVDYFRVIDQKIISDLVIAVEARTVTAGDVSLWVKQRRQSHWYAEFEHEYQAIDKASQFFTLLDQMDFAIPSFDEGIRLYAQEWFKVDQLYRHFIYALQRSGQISLLRSLSDKVENYYSNHYLLGLNNDWQEWVDHCKKWSSSSALLQRDFFGHKVQPFLKKQKKVYVIISDALRYEVADELLSRIRQEDRYDATLTPALSMLPSYTQLGMAALLPNRTFTLDAKKAVVAVDGISSQGTANRIKILKKSVGEGATALKDKAFMEMMRDDARSLLREHELIYIYHNRIDHTGDKLQSEGEAFKAANETLDDLLRLIKKLTATNASNILITADHGFIYQNRVLDESEFIDASAIGDTVSYRDRRFLLGKDLITNTALRHFKAQELWLEADIEVQIPKSINRLRLQGSGSRFVHGGASLQEVVIPVISVNKKRTSDLSSVDIDILRGSSTVITSGQLAITLYQRQPVTDKVQTRQLRIGLYAQDGVLISDVHEQVFDLTSDSPRERELKLRLLLSHEADNYNNQEVQLKLEEKHARTSHYKEYQVVHYTIRRSFSTDFDF